MARRRNQPRRVTSKGRVVSKGHVARDIVTRAGSNLVARSRWYGGSQGVAMRMLAHLFFADAVDGPAFSGYAKCVPRETAKRYGSNAVNREWNATSAPPFYDSVTHAPT